MAEVAFAGDWHGDIEWAKRVLKRLHGRGVKKLFHVGDFGLWPKGYYYLAEMQEYLEELDMVIWVTPGNHEDWPRLVSMFRDYKGPAKAYEDITRILFLPKGFRWEEQGVSFVSLGGAPSIDRAFRKPGKTWWAEEAVTEEDVALATAGGRADILITHDSPVEGTKAVDQIVNGPSSWYIKDIAYSAVGREMTSRASSVIQPTLHVHGHYHVFDIAETHKVSGDVTTVVSLANEYVLNGNVVLLELDNFRSGAYVDLTIPSVRNH